MRNGVKPGEESTVARDDLFPGVKASEQLKSEVWDRASSIASHEGGFALHAMSKTPGSKHFTQDSVASLNSNIPEDRIVIKNVINGNVSLN